MKKVVSGIQPTNNLTLGNYLGAIKNFVDYQQQYNMLIFIADLHALSSPGNVDEINRNSINIVKTYLACGLDKDKVMIFRQSDISAHTELFNVLLNFTTIGELSRMTQFKDKSAKSKKANGTEFITTSLLTYPVLMAADILLYDANLVIVGSDQKQHLELTRNIAERLNNKYKSKLFIIPDILINDKGAKILDLQDPSKKMSKSSENHKGVIFLNESKDSITKKISSALTDNLNIVKYDCDKQPGISNLINIYSILTNKTYKEVEDQFTNIKNYGEFKKEVINVVVDKIMDIQNKINQISDDEVIDILNNNATLLNKIANDKMSEIYVKIGVKND